MNKKLATKINNYLIMNLPKKEEAIYKGGKRKNGVVTKLLNRWIVLYATTGIRMPGVDAYAKDILLTLHYNNSEMNDIILEMTKENSDLLSNEEKNIVNLNLFARGSPQTISDEVDIKMRGTVAEEISEFNRLIKEGEFRNHLPYYNREGELKETRSWVLCDKNYNPENNDVFFIVKKDEVKYFKKHGHFPLRADNDNDKLGKGWLYLAFQLAWACSGDAKGYCQCPDECYAKRMENTFKNVRDRILKSMNAWQHIGLKEKIKFYTKWIINPNPNIKWTRKGIRFCDTGDVPNQEALNEIFALVRGVTKELERKGMDTNGRFYIYSTRHDLDWTNKPWELILNASNEELFNKVPDANWFRVIDSFDKIPEKYKNPKTLHICNCNCKACDYCSICRNTIIWEVLG